MTKPKTILIAKRGFEFVATMPEGYDRSLPWRKTIVISGPDKEPLMLNMNNQKWEKIKI